MTPVAPKTFIEEIQVRPEREHSDLELQADLDLLALHPTLERAKKFLQKYSSPCPSRLGGTVYGGPSLCSPAPQFNFGTIVILDTNCDGLIHVGVDKITDRNGKILSLQSKEVREVLQELKVASFSQLKNLSAAASYYSGLKKISEEIEKGQFYGGDAIFLSDLKRFAQEAGIPFGANDEAKMKSFLEAANQKGLNAIAGRVREAAARGDISEAFQQIEKFKYFGFWAGIPTSDSKPVLDAVLNEMKDLLLQNAEDAVKAADFAAAFAFFDDAKKCADQSGNPIEPEQAEKILLPCYFEKIWSSARLGDVAMTESLRDSLRREATSYGIDPLTYEYRFPAALDASCRNATENSFRAAETELAASSPRMKVIQDFLQDAKNFSIQGHMKFDEGRANKIGGRAWILRSRQHSENAVFKAGVASLKVASGDFSGIAGDSESIAADVILSSATFGKGVLTLLGF